MFAKIAIQHKDKEDYVIRVTFKYSYIWSIQKIKGDFFKIQNLSKEILNQCDYNITKHLCMRYAEKKKLIDFQEPYE